MGEEEMKKKIKIDPLVLGILIAELDPELAKELRKSYEERGLLKKKKRNNHVRIKR
jgi:hypothetical protein